jgi:putative (di)nucleoside polyphosphate hydrolase
MLLSCGILVLNERREILLAHVTHAPQWDIPKGCAEPGEPAQQAAVRETREECGLELEDVPLLELGRFNYQPRKNLHLFAVKLPASAIDLARCRCSTTFADHKGRYFPEVDAFRWVAFDAVSRHCKPRLWKVLLEEVGLNDLHERLEPYPGTVQR